MKKQEAQSWILVVVFSAAILVGLSTLGLYIHDSPPPAQPLSRPQPKIAVAKTTPVTVPDPEPPPDGPLHQFDSPFAKAMDRLNHAFQNHPAMEAEDMISKVNSQTIPGHDRPCPLSWRDNEATLSISRDQIKKISATDAITTCAEAIERLQ